MKYSLKCGKFNMILISGLQETPLSRSGISRHYRTVIMKRSSNIELGTSQETSSYIKTVLWSCLCVQLFVHPSLLHLLPIPIGYFLARKLFTWIKPQFSEFNFDYFTSKKEAFLPQPVEIILKELYKIEREILKNIPKFLDTIVTCLMIFGMIVGVVLTCIFISGQMYSESVYIVQTSGKMMTSVTNSTWFKQMNETLGVHHQAYFKGMEDIIDSGYRYGREYISSSVVSIFKRWHS